MFDPQPNTPRPRFVDARPARHHVEQLTAAGLTPPVIAKLAGLETRRVTTLLSGRTERGDERNPDYRERISRRIAEALISVPIPEGMFVDSTGTVRRLRALVRLGHDWITLDVRLMAHEVPAGTANTVAFDECMLVDTELAAAVAAVFDDLHAVPGTSRAARDFGRRHRWAAPLAWQIDDDDPHAGAIDDPAAAPFGVEPLNERARHRACIDDLAEIVADHRDVGHDDEAIARALGITDDALAKRLQRAGIPQRRRGEHSTAGPRYVARYRIRLPHTNRVAS